MEKFNELRHDLDGYRVSIVAIVADVWCPRSPQDIGFELHSVQVSHAFGMKRPGKENFSFPVQG